MDDPRIAYLLGNGASPDAAALEKARQMGLRLMGTPNAPVIGNRPDVQAAVSGAVQGVAEPFGQLGRVMMGQSQEPWQDLGMAAIGMVGPPGARAALKPAAHAAEEAAARGITAFHGSPHDFDKFNISRIGTGEGAQAYGHGLYFAERPEVAEMYKGTVPNGLGPLNIRNLWTPAEVPSGKGKMYQVSIKADPEHFLDWDKPLSEQSPKVREILKGKVSENEPIGSVLGRAYGNPMHAGDILGKDRATQEELTAGLREAGIPGIKYLDQGSRGKGDGTRNYVVFDDKLIDILKKYGLAGMLGGAGAAAASDPRAIADHLMRQ